jgi:hypothetical protein
MEGEHEKSRDQTEGSGQQQPLGQQSENQTGQQDRQQPEGQQSQQQFGQQQGQSATGQAQSSDTDTLSKDDDDVGPGGYSPESGGSDLGGGETGLGDSGGSSSQGGFVGSQGQESGEYLQKGGRPQSGFAEQGRGASDQSDVERVAPTSEDRDSDIEGSSDNS